MPGASIIITELENKPPSENTIEACQQLWVLQDLFTRLLIIIKCLWNAAVLTINGILGYAKKFWTPNEIGDMVRAQGFLRMFSAHL